MSKAYDRVEWNYLESLLQHMYFPSRMVELLMRCVKSATYSFSINRKVYGKLKPSRGLRQGDPLSPLLFVLCAQGLSSLLSAQEINNNFTVIRFPSQGPRISHLFLLTIACSVLKRKLKGVR